MHVWSPENAYWSRVQFLTQAFYNESAKYGAIHDDWQVFVFGSANPESQGVIHFFNDYWPKYPDGQNWAQTPLIVSAKYLSGQILTQLLVVGSA